MIIVDMVTDNFQRISEINRFVRTQLKTEFSSLCKSPVMKIFNKLRRGLKNVSLWKKFAVCQNIRIYQPKSMRSL